MDHVDLFQTAMDAFNRGDADAFVAACAEECEWYPFLGARDGNQPYRGRDGVREWFESTTGAFDGLSTVSHKIREVDDRLVALGEIRYRGKDSGIDVSAPLAWVLDFRGELVWRGRVYLHHEEALEEAGLAELGVRPTR
jgi:ketosteroid isomerase-like protein